MFSSHYTYEVRWRSAIGSELDADGIRFNTQHVENWSYRLTPPIKENLSVKPVTKASDRQKLLIGP